MKKRAAIYCRVSTDLQRDNYYVPTQVRACIEHAEKKGYRIDGDGTHEIVWTPSNDKKPDKVIPANLP